MRTLRGLGQDQAVQLQPSDSTSWYQWVTDFDTAWNNFNTNYQALLSLSDYIYNQHPELKDEYDKLVNDGSTQYAELVQLKDTRDTVAGWLGSVSDYFKSIFGMSGTENMGNMGFVWVAIGIGAAAAALAAVTYWITDAYKFAKKVNAMQDLEAKGYSPQDAAKAVATGTADSGSGIFANISSTVMWIGIGLLAIFVLPKLIDAFKGK